MGFVWRSLWRELRSGELRLLFAALVVAVAAVTAVSFVGDRVHNALQREAQQMMGGDLIVIGDHSLPENQLAEARRRQLSIAETLLFPSMVIGQGGAQLADIKAVSATYPLRGKLEIQPSADELASAVAHGPAQGTVWVDERLAAALNARAGDELRVGRQSFRVSAVLTREPDRGFSFFSLAPRLMMHLDDIPGTGLVQFGARVRYSLLVAGEASDVETFRDWLNSRLERGQRIEDIRQGRPEIRSALDRAERFLGLATLLTVILSAVATAMAARRYMQRHLDACAVMRCLGMTHRRLIVSHFLLFVSLALVAGSVGCLTGFVAHLGLLASIGSVLAVDLPAPGGSPVFNGFAVAALLLLGFALPPLLQLARVPTLRVLRNELGPPRPALLGGYAVGLLLLAGLIVRVAGDLRLGLIVCGGFVVALGAFWGFARLAVYLGSKWRGGTGFGWRQGLAGINRHAASSTLQVVALAIGLMAMLLLTVIRGQLLDTWQQSVPADAPNRFVINIQPEQRDEVAAFLKDAGVDADLLPMVRARLLAIGQRAVSAVDYPDDERAQRLVEREFNLSWQADLPAGNSVSAGQWFSASGAGREQASVEEGLAKTLGISLGDELRFMVGGQEKRLRVTSLRKLAWDSMRVNFFVIAPPGVLDDAPASYITSFHLDAAQSGAASGLVKRFPNLTMIDVAAIIGELQSLIGQVAGVVQFVFLFAVLAGALVLYAALLSAFDERRHELAVMRALGAQRTQLLRAMLAELAIVGALAGLLAALGAMLLGMAIARQVFELALVPNVALPPLAMLGGAMLVTAIGWLAMRRLLQTPPLLALRNAV